MEFRARKHILISLGLFCMFYSTFGAPMSHGEPPQKSRAEILQERGVDISEVESKVERAIEEAVLSATEGANGETKKGNNDIRHRFNVSFTWENDEVYAGDEKSEEDSQGDVNEEEKRGKIKGVVEIENAEMVKMNNDSEIEFFGIDESDCQDEEDAKLEEILKLERDRDYALLHFPSTRQQPIGLTQKFNNYREPLETTCPEVGAYAETVQEASICPWVWFQNIEAARYPRIMMFARCQCSDCREVEGTCEVVWYNVRVLRRTGGCVGGKYVYEPALEPVPVACTCVPARRININTTGFQEQGDNVQILGVGYSGNVDLPKDPVQQRNMGSRDNVEILDVSYGGNPIADESGENFDDFTDYDNDDNDEVDDVSSFDSDGNDDIESEYLVRPRRSHNRHYHGVDRSESFYWK